LALQQPGIALQSGAYNYIVELATRAEDIRAPGCLSAGAGGAVTEGGRTSDLRPDL